MKKKNVRENEKGERVEDGTGMKKPHFRRSLEQHLCCYCSSANLFTLILCRALFVANAGDSRAVLGKRGRAVELFFMAILTDSF
jgi:serine/threonine protein phosphatase PrpC